MKKLIIALVAACCITTAFSSKQKMLTSIYGTIDPPDMAIKVWAINGTDSVTITPESGRFSLAIPHAGKWKLFVKAVKPYKDATVENIVVTEGKSTDAGVIKLASE